MILSVNGIFLNREDLLLLKAKQRRETKSVPMKIRSVRSCFDLAMLYYRKTCTQDTKVQGQILLQHCLEQRKIGNILYVHQWQYLHNSQYMDSMEYFVTD